MKMKNKLSSNELKEGSRFILPAGPSDLCFDKNEFLEESFSVDIFLKHHKKNANLDIIRDDLGMYLKILRSAMIELINKDYADFVNLSSNLIGLDKAILNIHVPLAQLKEEILQVKQTLEMSMNDVSLQLKHRRSLHSKKKLLSSLLFVQKMLQKLESLVYNGDIPLSINEIERAASEYNRLRYAISNVGPFQTRSETQKIDEICEILVLNLKRIFLDAVQFAWPEEAAHCLRLYAILDKTTYVEDLFKKEVLRVKLSDIICESFLNTNPNGLQGVYHNILKILKEDMKHIVRLTSEQSRDVGFDFIVNSFWPEVEYRLEVNLPSIYAPGNPEIFYKRFCETMDFLNEIDKQCLSEEHVKKLHSHPQYKTFIELWNLPVYFQIRFQEIAGLFENTLNSSTTSKIAMSGSDFHISCTSALWNSIEQCWSDGIYMDQLGHRFWKLTLQLLARYTVWVEENLNENQDIIMQTYTSEINSPRGRNLSNESENPLTFLVCLYLDLQLLMKEIPKLENNVIQKLDCISQQSKSLISKCMRESVEEVNARAPRVVAVVVDALVAASLPPLRQVADIPRLFRRTNREAPSVPCAYVTAALRPCAAFARAHALRLDDALLQQWLATSFSIITQHYYKAVSDVLTSVQKTEESLQRLKKFRDRSSTATFEIRGSDDDKIRKQIAIDVQSYSCGILDLGVRQESVGKLQDLITMVEEASNQLKDVK